MTAENDYSVRIAIFRRSERVKSVEFIARFVLLWLCALAAWVWIELYYLPIWILAFYLVIAIEKAALALYPRAESARFFYILIGINACIGSVYAVLPAYLWMDGRDDLKFGAMALIVGGSLNVFLVRARVWEVSLAYMVPLGTSMLVIATTYYKGESGGPVFYTSITVAFAVIIYFGVTVYEANRVHKMHLTTQAQFFQAQKMETIGTLSGGIAHDFNNLLSIAQGSLELLQHDPDHPERQAFINEGVMACERGAALTRQLLALGRNATLVPRKLDPNKVLAETSRLIARILPESIGYSNQIDPTLPAIKADETTLQAAVLNLAINARDAMPKGGQIRMEAQLSRDNGSRNATLGTKDYVAISIHDTGIGIEPDHIGRIFDPFFSTKHKSSGSGLGLAMVDGFVRNSGGVVEVASWPNVGSCFTLYLPALTGSPEECDEDPKKAADTAPLTSTAAEKISQTVLLRTQSAAP